MIPKENLRSQEVRTYFLSAYPAFSVIWENLSNPMATNTESKDSWGLAEVLWHVLLGPPPTEAHSGPTLSGPAILTHPQ